MGANAKIQGHLPSRRWAFNQFDNY